MAVILEKLPPIGQFILLRLDELNKTQKWLSIECGISYVYIQQLIHGKTNTRRPSANVVFKISDALQVDPRKLYELFL